MAVQPLDVPARHVGPDEDGHLGSGRLAVAWPKAWVRNPDVVGISRLYVRARCAGSG